MLKDRRRRRKALLKYAPTGILEIDYHIVRFTSVNDAMCRILGYAEDELLAINPFEILDDRASGVSNKGLEGSFQAKASSLPVDFGVLTKNGKKVYAMLNVTVTYNNGKPESAFVVAQDNTERKLMEDALKESEGKLPRALQRHPISDFEIQIRV